MRRPLLGWLAWAAILASPATANAASLPEANKLIALVQASGCDMARLRPRLEAAGRAMREDRRTRRVSIDWPADAVRNLDLLGRLSPFAAAIEVSAGRSVLAGLAHRIRLALGSGCRVGFYRVHERRLMTTSRSWPLGDPSPASKTLVTLNRKAGLSLEDFDREWAGPHARLALAWRAARGGDGHYVQNLIVGTIGRDTPPLDGIGESEGPGGAPSAQEREARVQTAAHAATFQDVAGSTMFVARETILKD